MKKEEYLWVVLVEECAEIQQAAAKILRFGLEDTHPDCPEVTNEQQLLTEFYQMSAVMDELQEKQMVGILTAEAIEQIKRESGAVYEVFKRAGSCRVE